MPSELALIEPGLGAQYSDERRLEPPSPAERSTSARSGRQVVTGLLSIAVFLSVYLTWRPFSIMFTYSDGLFIACAGILLLSHRLPTRPLGSMTSVWLLSFSVMLAGLLVGSLANGDPLRWLIVGAQYTFAWAVLPLLLIGHGSQVTDRLILALVAGVVCMELVAVTTYFWFDGAWQEPGRLLGLGFITGGGRVAAFVGDANWNAAITSMALVFALYCAAKRLIGNELLLAVATALCLALVLTASVTGFAAAVSAVGIFCIVAAVRPRLSSLLYIVAVVGAITQAGVKLPDAFATRVAGALATGDLEQAGTYVGRMDLIEEALTLINDRMLVGLGVDQFRVVSEHGAPVHNIYLLVFAEGGIFALLGWLGMLATIAVVVAKAYAHDRIVAGLATSVAWIFLMFSTANPHMYNRMWAVPVLLALATVRDALHAARPAPGDTRHLL